MGQLGRARRLPEALVEQQPSPSTPAQHTALLRWLTLSVANANPGIDDDELAEQVAARLREMAAQVAARLREMAAQGDETAKGAMEAPFNEYCTNLARAAVALHGAPWVPDPPAIPKQHRMDSIAATVLELTGWTSVAEPDGGGDLPLAVRRRGALRGRDGDARGGQPAYRREPRVRRGPRATPGDRREVLVTRDDILEHADDDRRVLVAAGRYARKQARWHDRLIRALRPYGDRSTSVGEAVRRAAQDLGVQQDGRSFEEFAGLVVAAAEARGGAAAG